MIKNRLNTLVLRMWSTAMAINLNTNMQKEVGDEWRKLRN